MSSHKHRMHAVILPSPLPTFASTLDGSKIFLKQGATFSEELIEAICHEETHCILIRLGEEEAGCVLNRVWSACF